MFRRQAIDLVYYKSFIHVVSLDNILKRGFAYLEYKGKIVTELQLLNENDELTIVAEKHTIQTKIQKINEN